MDVNDSKILKVLWISPAFNHYKARLLNRLARDQNIDLKILSGSGRVGMGDKELEQEWSFKYERVKVMKSLFGFSKNVRKKILNNIAEYNWVLIPAEKKNILLLLYCFFLKYFKYNFKIFSYNHEIIKPKKGDTSYVDILITKFFFLFYDKIIFYSQTGYNFALKNKLLKTQKAYWANNTLDTTEINKYFNFTFPPSNIKTIVFIGRLIPNKRIGYLLDFFHKLEKDKEIKYKLEIIGDGPERNKVKASMKKSDNIIWYGSLADEEKISSVFKKASLVFVPGLSGLSVVHAISNARPYATLSSKRHGPEISYLKNGFNGFILEDKSDKIVSFLKDSKQINEFCLNAFESSKQLTVEKWISKITYSLNE